jgi:WhiB family redox-sensing transcriptional regulator
MRPVRVAGGQRTPDWMAGARCRDMDPAVFFPEDARGVESAQLICARCDVSRQCLDYALEHRVAHGVWGGASERARVRILRARRLHTAEMEPVAFRPCPPE